MRTKALLLTAAIGAAGIATSMAQVYSVNAVGYVNQSIPLNTASTITYALVANPLNGTNNNIATILGAGSGVPVGTQLFKFTGGVFESAETYFGAGFWDPGTAVLKPGEGFFLLLDNAASSNPTTITFVGEVPQGNLTNSVPNGYSIQASQVPQAGAVSATLGLNPSVGSQLFVWNVALQRYDDAYTYFGAGFWDPSEPVIPVAGAFFLLNPEASFSWGRTFSVN